MKYADLKRLGAWELKLVCEEAGIEVEDGEDRVSMLEKLKSAPKPKE